MNVKLKLKKRRLRGEPSQVTSFGYWHKNIITFGTHTGWEDGEAEKIDNFFERYFPEYEIVNKNYFFNQGRGFALLFKKPIFLQPFDFVVNDNIKINSIKFTHYNPIVEFDAISTTKIPELKKDKVIKLVDGGTHVIKARPARIEEKNYKLYLNYAKGQLIDYGWPISQDFENALVKLVRETVGWNRKSKNE